MVKNQENKIFHLDNWHANCYIYQHMSHTPIFKIFNRKAKRLFVPLMVLFLSCTCVTVASAMLSVMRPHRGLDELQRVESIHISSTSEQQRSHAPEPTTMTLFGSGILGIIVRFVQRSYERFKRLMDIAGSAIALVLLSPLCLMTAIFIRLCSKGPILFTQTRVGKDGKHFEIYKFRTMHVDAEKYTGPVWAKANDDRLIPVGTFIRKAHIDEIPQFINVLKGEMSIIGPRPERPVFVEQFKRQIPDYEKRISVKPGITGLAQVWHKYDETIEDVKRKIKYDLLYIKKMCLWTDVRIIVRTVRVVFTGEGAR